MSESALQKKIITYLDGIGAYTIKTIATNKRGCPDILFCINGMFCAVEVKAQARCLQSQNYNNTTLIESTQAVA